MKIGDNPYLLFIHIMKELAVAELRGHEPVEKGSLDAARAFLRAGEEFKLLFKNEIELARISAEIDGAMPGDKGQ